MKMLDLFAGIGGFSLAAHWMGWETAAFVEWDPFCQKELAKNFPDVPIYGDINQFSYEQEKERIGTVDIVCGGFPCQPVSVAGKRKGKDDERWGWTAMFRVVRESKPAWVVGENVAGLLTMDGGAVFEEICADLESEGYAVQAFCIPAIAKGAPHRRDRVWIVAHHQNAECNGRPNIGNQEDAEVWKQRNVVAGNGIGVYNGAHPADAAIPRFSQPGQPGERQLPTEAGAGMDDRLKQPDSDAAADAQSRENIGQSGGGFRGQGVPQAGESDNRGNWNTHWLDVALATCHVRMDDGLSPQLDFVGNRDNRAKRLKALGNAIVPQVVYEIFQAIEKEQKP